MANELHTENRPDHHEGRNTFVGADIITTKDTLAEAAKKAETGSIKQRKLEAELRTDYYYDLAIHQHVRHLLDHQFKDPNNMKFQISWRNILRTIIKKTALVYKDSPVREIFVEVDEVTQVPNPEGEGTIEEMIKVARPSPKDQELWNEIETKTKLNVLLKTVNRMTQLTRRVVIKVGFDEDKDIPKLSIILPNILDIVVDERDVLTPLAMFWNTSLAKRVMTGNKNFDNAIADINAEKTEYEFWSTDSDKLDEDLRGKNFIFNGKGKPVELTDEQKADNPNSENKIKDANGKSIIPVVEFGAEMPIDDWFIGGGGDLINAQETINVLMTYLNYMVKMQSFSVPVARGVQANEAEDSQGGGKDGPGIIIDPSLAILLKETDSDVSPSSFEFVTPDAKIEIVKNLIRDKFIDIATDYAIAVQNFVAQSTPASGIAIKLQNQELLDFRSDEIELYRCSEQDLFETIRSVQNTFSNRKFTKEAKMKTNFAEVKFPEDPKETLETLEKGIELGITSAVQFVMSQDPDLTEQEAKDLILENLKRRRQTTSEIPSVENGIIAPQALNINPNAETVEDELAEEVDPNQFIESEDVAV